MATVETIRFRLRDGVSADDFLRHNQKVENEYMALRPGFISRETSRSADGEWLVVVHWATEKDAEATINAFFHAPETQGFLSVVDHGSVQSGRYERIEH